MALKRIFDTSLRLAKSRWVESTAALVGMAAIQMVSFILLGRALGAVDYAVIVSIAAVVTVAVELVGLGCGDMLIRSVAREPSTYKDACGDALRWCGYTLPVVVVGSLAIVEGVFRPQQALYIVAGLTFSELVSARSLALAEHLCIAHQNIRLANIYRITSALVRLALIATAILIFKLSGIVQWFPWQFLYGALFSPLILFHAIFTFGAPHFGERLFRVRDGVAFSANQMLRSLQFNLDRIVLAGVLPARDLGNYGVAARLIQFSLLPVQSVLRITYPQFFRAGRSGLQGSRAYAYRLFPAVAAIGLVMSAGVYLSATLMGRLLGPSFGMVEPLMKMLAVLPAILSAQYAFADALTGADMQRRRTAILAVGVAVIGASVAGGAHYAGVNGAIWALIGSNLLLGTCFWAAVELGVLNERHKAIAE